MPTPARAVLCLGPSVGPTCSKHCRRMGFASGVTITGKKKILFISLNYHKVLFLSLNYKTGHNCSLNSLKPDASPLWLFYV